MEGFVTHSITIADEPQKARGKQPAFGLNWLTYFTSDRLVTQWMGGYYRKHAKRP